MQYEDFEKLVLARQSCRNFDGQPVSEEAIKKIVDLARLSPSACNSQPWKVYAVIKGESGEKFDLVKKSLQDVGLNKFLDGAGAFLVISEKTGMLKADILNRFSPKHFIKYDAGELCAYITLTAETLGISSCIIGWVNGKKLCSAINLPATEDATLVVALGYSEIPKREKVRKSLDEVYKLIK